jgi:hypothetical protein
LTRAHFDRVRGKPLTLELRSSSARLFVGVSGFSSPPGTILVSHAVAEALNLRPEDENSEIDLIATRCVVI